MGDPLSTNNSSTEGTNAFPGVTSENKASQLQPLAEIPVKAESTIPSAPIPKEAITNAEPLVKSTPELIKTTAIEKSSVQPKKRIDKNTVLFALIFIAAIILAALIFLLVSSKEPTANETNTVEEQGEVVSLPTGFVLKTYNGKVYTMNFKYTSELGSASGITSKLTYPSTSDSVGGDCKVEDITFTSDIYLKINISTGHCEGTAIPSTDYTMLTAKDGKRYFMTIKKLDQTLFPDMYTITVTGGVDSTENLVTSTTGVHIDAIRIKDLEKYKKYIEDIISTISVELSPLKSEKFDTESNI